MKVHVLALPLLMLGGACSLNGSLSGWGQEGGGGPAPAAAQEAPPPGDPPAAGPPKDWVQLPAPALPPGPPPKLTIVSPAMDAEVIGKETRTPEDKYASFECLLDSRTFGFQLAAENWPVRAGGPGVLVVVDGVYATVTHDLSKPVLLADLEPYEYNSSARSINIQYPMFTCIWHWIAVVPTDSTGQMLPVAPVVSWWHTVPEGQDPEENPGETSSERERRLSRGLPVVNWPLIGPLYPGTGWNGTARQNSTQYRSGHLLKNPKRVVFDWVVAQRRSSKPCDFGIATQASSQEWEGRTEIGTRGTVVLPTSFTDQILVLDDKDCGGLNYFSGLWSKRPANPPRSYNWPVPGSAQAENIWQSEQGRAAVRRATEPRPSGSTCATNGDCSSGVCVHIPHSKKAPRCQ